MNGVNVLTGARLHFGLLCGDKQSAWHYGGLGLMIDAPVWQLQVSLSQTAEDIIVASPAAASRMAKLLETFRKTWQVSQRFHCQVTQKMSFHSGLGSGTQLTLAMATGLLVLLGKPRPANIGPVAEQLGRSRRSAIGTLGFDRGGFIVDRGKTASKRCDRFPFPEDWRMVVVTPKTSEGLSGTQEETFFGQKSFLDQTALDAISELVERQIVPSLRQQNHQIFAEALGQYGRLIGEYYSSGQGGIYSSPLIRNLADTLAAKGFPIPVQSSWGPTACIPAASIHHADEIIQAIEGQSPAPLDAVITVACGRNVGATVSSLAPDDQRSFG